MVVGHKKQWEFLQKSAELHQFPHAFLFSGQEKLGKKKMALEWASLLFNQNVEDFHPDLILIEPQGEENKLSSSSVVKTRRKKEIQIEQIRELIWKLSLKPHSAPFKIAIIDEAHTMNSHAQTCLLKTLEEPKGRSVLVLVSQAPEYLLPTILSRVETLKFYPVAKKEIKKYLETQGVETRTAEELAEISLGKPGRALDFLFQPQKIKILQERIEELKKISKADLALRFQYIKELAEDPEELKEDLDIWLGYFRKILLDEENSRYSVSELKNILKNIQTTEYLISTTNVNHKLALENLMLEI
jgi:DNA polymerase-3 subunit delta'